MTLHVAAHEHGLIRVFAINRAPADMAAALHTQGKEALASALLGQDLATGEVELFAMQDLAGIGLSGYLAEGYTVPSEQLRAARPKLDALDGYVMLVFSAAFEGREVVLAPTPDVTLIGTFGEQQPDNMPLPLEAESAAPYTGISGAQPKGRTQGQRYGSLVVAALATFVLVILLYAFL